MLRVCVFGMAMFASTVFAQRGATPTQSVPNAGVGGATGRTTGGGNFEAGQLSTEAGSADGVNRDFGDGLVGRGDTSGRFVGNADVQNTSATRRPADFRGLDRQRATPPAPPVSPVRPTLRLNLQSVSSPTYTPPVRELRDDFATGRALDRVSPSLSYGVRGDVAVLRGTADTPRRRKLAAALLRLQPGVRRVDDRSQIRFAVPPLP